MEDYGWVSGCLSPTRKEREAPADEQIVPTGSSVWLGKAWGLGLVCMLLFGELRGCRAAGILFPLNAAWVCVGIVLCQKPKNK